MGAAASPDPSTSAVPENTAARVQVPALQVAPSSGDVEETTTTITTTTTTPAPTAGTPECGTVTCPGPSTCPPWRLLCARHKNSSLFAGCKLASAKVSPGEEEALDDIETGSTSSVDTSPVSPETIKAAAAAAAAAVAADASAVDGCIDLEAGKQAAGSDDKYMQSVSFLGRLLMMYSGECWVPPRVWYAQQTHFARFFVSRFCAVYTSIPDTE